MKAKDVKNTFDSSVRKLKKIIGAEADAVSVSVPSQLGEEISGAVAVCQRQLFDDWSLKSKIVIWPDKVLEFSKGWSEDEIFFTIRNTACHEMAHHLEALRWLKHCRKEFRTEDEITQNFNSRFKNPAAWHDRKWSSIMEELGGESEPTYFHRVKVMPKIFK